MENTYEDIWYAAKATRIVYMPPRLLETFGESRVQYLMVSEDMDQPGLVRLRSGLVMAERPRILTPQYFIQQAVENFGPEARRYFEEVMSRADNARFIQYGLHFRKQEFKVQTVNGNVEEVAEQAAKDAQDDLQELRGVVIAPDDLWEVSLLHFITRLVQRSLPRNARDIASSGLLDLREGIPVAVHRELEADMRNCSSLEQARNLGAKLRDYGVFEQYEDRFYELYRRFK